jgi:hypothetical protein
MTKQRQFDDLDPGDHVAVCLKRMSCTLPGVFGVFECFYRRGHYYMRLRRNDGTTWSVRTAYISKVFVNDTRRADSECTAEDER